jgi:hypothetical protein
VSPVRVRVSPLPDLQGFRGFGLPSKPWVANGTGEQASPVGLRTAGRSAAMRGFALEPGCGPSRPKRSSRGRERLERPGSPCWRLRCPVPARAEPRHAVQKSLAATGGRTSRAPDLRERRLVPDIERTAMQYYELQRAPRFGASPAGKPARPGKSAAAGGQFRPSSPIRKRCRDPR